MQRAARDDSMDTDTQGPDSTGPIHDDTDSDARWGSEQDWQANVEDELAKLELQTRRLVQRYPVAAVVGAAALGFVCARILRRM